MTIKNVKIDLKENRMKTYNTKNITDFAIKLGFERCAKKGDNKVKSGHKYYANKDVSNLTLSISGHDRNTPEQTYKSIVNQIALFLRIENEYRDNPRISPQYQERLDSLFGNYKTIVKDVISAVNGEFKMLLPKLTYDRISALLPNPTDKAIVEYVKEHHDCGEKVIHKINKSKEESINVK